MFLTSLEPSAASVWVWWQVSSGRFLRLNSLDSDVIYCFLKFSIGSDMVNLVLSMLFGDVHLCSWMSLWENIVVIMARLFRQQNEINFSPFRFVYHAFLQFHLQIRAYFRFLHWGRLSGGCIMAWCFGNDHLQLFIKHIFVIFVRIVGGSVYLYDSCLIYLN